MSEPMETALCIVNSKQAFWFVGAWAAVVLVHAFWRSTGSAPQDPIRPSGPG